MNKNISLPRIVNWLVILSLIWVNFNTNLYKRDGKVIMNDVVEYYTYLPALFVYHDITLKFTEKNPGYYGDKFWPIPAPNGGHVTKMSMGMAMLYSPFFFAAHITAKLTGLEANGFSPIYKLALQMSCLFYLAIGLYFLRRLLQRYFNDVVTSITLVCILVGTNMYFYSSFEAPLTHAYSFSLFVIFMFLTLQWHANPNIKNAILIGLLGGLITLIRPTNIAIWLFFVLWGIKNWKDVADRLKLFLSKYTHILIMGLCMLMVWLPQLIYWKYNTDQWFFYSYRNEKFFFTDPMFINGLFSYRKGWLLYTPMMSLAMVGFIMLYRQQRDFFIPILTFFLVNLYIIVCWWTWWYGGSFGMRPLIESYALLTIPFAAFVNSLLKAKLGIKIAGLALCFILIIHSLFETGQYTYGAIHWDSMSKKAYWYSFGKLHPDGEFYKLLKAPDYEKAIKGERDQ